MLETPIARLADDEDINRVGMVDARSVTVATDKMEV